MPLRRRDGTKTDVCGFKFSLNKEVLCLLSLNLGYMNIYTFIIITIQKAKKMKRIETVAKLIDTIRWARVFSLTILDHAKYYIVYVLVYNS